MNEELKIIINEYIVSVNKACAILLENYNLKSKDELIKFRATNPWGEFAFNGKNEFFFHGRGCKFSNDKINLDWDFGYGDKWCGLNPWLLADYIKENNPALYNIFDGNKIEREFDMAVNEGTMFIKHDLYYLKKTGL